MAKNLFICVDGATFNYARSVRFEENIARLTAQVTTPLRPLKSVNPSSTAPAHASAFSGKLPIEHGILGNFYNAVSVVQRNYDPVKWIHPYTYGSTLSNTILDDLDAKGLSWAAVNMPQTVKMPVDGKSSNFTPYVLYAPEGFCILKNDHKNMVGEIKIFDRSISVLCRENFDRIQFVTPHQTVTSTVSKEPFFIIIQDSDSFICLWVRLETAGKEVKIWHSKAGMICGIPIDEHWRQILESLPPVVEKIPRFKDLDKKYTECPTEEWVTEMAIHLGRDAELDALWVRYNTVDHAQETLLFRENELPHEDAEQKIIEVYSHTLDEICRLISAQDDIDNVVIFSDHGIDRITQFISIPDIISEIFGPSHHVEVVYTDTRLLALRNIKTSNMSVEDIRLSCKRLGIQLQLPMSYEERSAGWDMLLWARNNCEFSDRPQSDSTLDSWAGHGGDCDRQELHGILLTSSNVSSKGFAYAKDIRELRRVWQELLGIQSTGHES
ncbi:alkaline phosphatase family protein [Corynebacterium striatum]|uniref:alkaline phosphatase family protein n=1 Tax=Corynebacterium striatum TaxID=43770 RepID=UPI001A24403C|nr:hypothetical protein [Corynebacterium striatum]HAT1477434.1 hypothetical protein [Corynebacterium striatum]HCD3017389.1 alkaline phosphatase family protein [Corynebacterium striatum]HCG2977140.1 alkaline phosphatase family protein [Corynebacterium striatum]HCG2990467.1 alkaline phosphatase family protein [Corynebacterium striatum]